MTSSYHRQEIAPGGASHAIMLHLNHHCAAPSKYQTRRLHRGRLVSQLVTARDDVIRIYDIYRSGNAPDSTHRIVLSREHALFGTVTGLQSIQTLASDHDGRDRLLVSLADAKLALLEWSDALDDLETVSIHTYERAPQLFNGLPHLFQSVLRTDPLSRCAALSLPHDALAILPFYRDAAEFEFDQETDTQAAPIDSWPYSPSFILSMREVDPQIENLRDFCFLPGFQKPTVAVLFSQPPTWTGLLAESKDNFKVYFFTLDLSASIDGPVVSADPYSGIAFRSAHPVVTASQQLPLDCLYVVPCPQSLGGVLIVSMSSFTHVDQSGRSVTTAITSWFKTVSSISVESTLDVEGVVDLQGSQLVFTGDTNGVLTLANGDLYVFHCRLDGRSMEGVRLERMQEVHSSEDGPQVEPAKCVPSSSLHLLAGSAEYVLSASMSGSSALYQLVATQRAAESRPEDGDSKLTEPEMDLDDDLYGRSDAQGATVDGANGAKAGSTVLTAAKACEIRSHGGFSSMARRRLPSGTKDVASRHGLVACNGAGSQAGLCYLEPRLAFHSKQNLSTYLRSPEEEQISSRFTHVFPLSDIDGELQLLCGASESDTSVYMSSGQNLHLAQTKVVQHHTLSAACILGDKIGRVTSASLQVLSRNLEMVNETLIADAAGSGTRILEARIEAGEYATVHTSNGECLFFKLNARQLKFELFDISTAVGTAHAVCLNVIRDVHSVFQQPASNDKRPQTQHIDEDEPDYDEDGDTAEDSLLRARSPGRRYLFVLDSSDVCRVFSLPELDVVWQNHSLAAQPQRLTHEQSRQGDLAAEQVVSLSAAIACHVGDTLSIVSFTEDNFLSVYEVVRDDTSNGAQHRSVYFNRTYVEILIQPTISRSFEPNDSAQVYRGHILQPLKIPGPEQEIALDSNAVFVRGAGRETSASIVYKPEQGSLRVLDWPEGDAVAIGSIVASSVPIDLVYCNRKGEIWSACIPAELQDGSQWLTSRYQTGREYTRVVAHDPTHSIIAASVSPCQFVLYDEDGEPVQDPAEDITPAFSQRGALEIFIDEDKQSPVDGYEFDANETVTALEVVSLDAPSQASGRKEFVAAGTTTYHGEDRTSKGAVYLFEVVEVVSGRYQLGKDLRLKLLCRDETKAPVTAIADINGFLINTSGQKLLVRALEKEEWLIPVAFQDCPFYITSVRVVKNFLLLSDVQRSLWFLAFQEEPYRFVSLGKDFNDQNVTMGNFLVSHDKLSLVATSGDCMGGIKGLGRQAGIIRLFEYAPSVPSSLGGQRLLIKSEYQTPSEAVASTTCRGRWLSDSELRGREEMRNKLLFAKANGALDSLAAVDDKVAKRLHLLQGQLVRSVQHFAGLNPRGFRTVRNDFVSRPLAKGILDGRLLNCFLYLSRPKMLEAVRSLQGVFDGLDHIKKRKHDNDDDNDNDRTNDNTEQDEESSRYAEQEDLRRKSEQKRVQLVIKDLLRLRTGFEAV